MIDSVCAGLSEFVYNGLSVCVFFRIRVHLVSLYLFVILYLSFCAPLPDSFTVRVSVLFSVFVTVSVPVTLTVPQMPGPVSVGVPVSVSLCLSHVQCTLYLSVYLHLPVSLPVAATLNVTDGVFMLVCLDLFAFLFSCQSVSVS